MKRLMRTVGTWEKELLLSSTSFDFKLIRTLVKIQRNLISRWHSLMTCHSTWAPQSMNTNEFWKNGSPIYSVVIPMYESYRSNDFRIWDQFQSTFLCRSCHHFRKNIDNKLYPALLDAFSHGLFILNSHLSLSRFHERRWISGGRNQCWKLSNLKPYVLLKLKAEPTQLKNKWVTADWAALLPRLNQDYFPVGGKKCEWGWHMSPRNSQYFFYTCVSSKKEGCS